MRKKDGESDRIRISTTISIADKKYLDKAGVSYSSALSMGVRAIKKEIGVDIISTENKIAAISASASEIPVHTILLKRTLNDDLIKDAIRKNKETLKRLGEKQ